MKRQRGAALMIILMIAGVLAAFFAVRALNGANTERDKVTAAALAQAKEALIGYAVAYRDTHADQVNGYLLLPDLGTTKNLMPGLGEGASAGNFLTNGANLSVVGRLPWRSLGLPALRDSQGACLWYAVSGAYQNEQTAPLMNWDTLGQFETFRSNGTPAGTISTVGVNLHNRPVAVIFAPGSVLAGQVRGPVGADAVTECGGNYNARNYLDTFNPNPLINNIVNYFGGLNFASGVFPIATPKQLAFGPVLDGTGNTLVNDRMLTITSDELFRSIKRRNDFKTDVDSMVEDIAQCLNNLPPASLPVASLTNKGVGDFPAAVPLPPDPTPLDVLSTCRPIVQQRLNVLQNWQDNLLYTRPAVAATVGVATCNAVLFFSGERRANQARATAADRSLAANYLEGTNATLFPASGRVLRCFGLQQ